MAMSNKSYLGDAVYADHDGFGIVLTTEDGISVTNKIYMEPEVYRALINWYKRLPKENQQEENFPYNPT